MPDEPLLTCQVPSSIIDDSNKSPYEIAIETADYKVIRCGQELWRRVRRASSRRLGLGSALSLERNGVKEEGTSWER